jgi:apolipoprotein D and lipocalin family protein
MLQSSRTSKIINVKGSKQMKKILIITLFLCLSVADRYAEAKSEPLKTVDYVDVERYMGKWYEIASIPQFFAFGCVAATANYWLLKDNSVLVYNSCHSFWLNGPRRSAGGRARVVDSGTNAKLKVKFNSVPVEGDYWVIELDEANYQYAVVGHPNRKYGWILSRSPQMDPDLLADLYHRLETVHGYDVSKFRKTWQKRLEN